MTDTEITPDAEDELTLDENGGRDPEDPVSWFLRQKAMEDAHTSTHGDYAVSLRHYQTFLRMLDQIADEIAWDIEDANQPMAETFKEIRSTTVDAADTEHARLWWWYARNKKPEWTWVRDYLYERDDMPYHHDADEYAWSYNTAEARFDKIHAFYQYMREENDTTGKYKGEFDRNPFANVEKKKGGAAAEAEEDGRRYISEDEMAELVNSIQHEQFKVIITLLAKSGMRLGELCNLDVYDLHVPEHVDPEIHAEYGDNTRPKLEKWNWPCLYVQQLNKGDTVRGETRTDGNKRVKSTTVPIDDETLRALKPWLAMRPDPISDVDADPLFCSTYYWGRRWSVNALNSRITEIMEERGYWEKGEGRTENVTPHYFRHWMSHYLNMRIDSDIVDSIRGDVGATTREKHYGDDEWEWEDYVYHNYCDGVYTFFD